MTTQGLQARIPKDQLASLSENSAKENPATEHLTPIVRIRSDGDLDDSKFMKTDSAVSESHPPLQDLPLHLFRIVRARILLDVSRRSAAAPQLKRRARLVFIRDVRSVITTPSLIFMTFLDTILLHLTSVESLFRVFPARGRAHQE